MSISNPNYTFAGLSKPEPLEPDPMGSQNDTQGLPRKARVNPQAGQMQAPQPSLPPLLENVITDPQKREQPCYQEREHHLTESNVQGRVDTLAKHVLEELLPKDELTKLADNRKQWEDMAKTSSIAELLLQQPVEPDSAKSLNQVLARCHVRRYACQLMDNKKKIPSLVPFSTLATGISKRRHRLPSPQEATAFALCLLFSKASPEIKSWARKITFLLAFGQANPSTAKLEAALPKLRKRSSAPVASNTNTGPSPMYNEC